MSNDPTADNRWSEEASSLFVDLADIFVPARAEQIATLTQLIPAALDEDFTAVELAAGDGTLARAILDAYPRCRYLALDGSAVMRAQLARALAPYGARVEIRDFTLEAPDWRAALPRPLRSVHCSLSVHHLDAAGKRALFADMAARLEPGGAFLLADLVEPASPGVARLYAAQMDEAARAQSLARYGDLRGYERFQAERWNYFAYDYGIQNDMDFPSGLFEQLTWLRVAGFTTVDCFWLRAGHAIYGGYKQNP